MVHHFFFFLAHSYYLRTLASGPWRNTGLKTRIAYPENRLTLLWYLYVQFADFDKRDGTRKKMRKENKSFLLWKLPLNFVDSHLFEKLSLSRRQSNPLRIAKPAKSDNIGNTLYFLLLCKSKKGGRWGYLMSFCTLCFTIWDLLTIYIRRGKWITETRRCSWEFW